MKRRRHRLLGRWSMATLAVLSSALVSACGVASGDAERAITAQSQERLTDPECERLDSDMASGETSFLCTALRRESRRIKVMVVEREEGQPLVLEWPCAPAGVRWRAIRGNPDLHCGRPVSAR